MRSRIVSSAALAALLAAAAPAWGEGTTTEKAEAESLFQEAKKLLARGKTPEACEKLQASLKLDPAGGTLMNLAMCHEIEGKTATAWTEFSEALAAARKAARHDREKAATDHLKALEPRLSHLTLAAPEAILGLEVKLDGVSVEARVLGTAISVDPGDHSATASAPGREPWATKLQIKEKESRTVTVPSLVSTAPTAPPPPPPSTPWKRPVGIAAAGAGAVLLAVGAGFGSRAISLGSRAASECPGLMCSPAGLSDVSDGRSAANVSNGTLAAGGALLAAGAVLLVLSFVESPAKQTGWHGLGGTF